MAVDETDDRGEMQTPQDRMRPRFSLVTMKGPL